MTIDLSSYSWEHRRKNYEKLSPVELTERIHQIKSRYGKKLLILGHLYQCPEILAVSDARGDSFQLSALAAQCEECETIIFCGVHFMAETADILANRPENVRKRQDRRVEVIIPDPAAGCFMADRANLEEVERCWEELAAFIDLTRVIPVTYVNSTAELKAFCGRHGGIACTSTNARAVLEWAFQQGERVLFFPDQHLGRNTALDMGIPESKLILWDPSLICGGNSDLNIKNSQVILWNGFCPVHQRFAKSDLDRVRQNDPSAKIVVHPECPREIVSGADAAGSTSMIMNKVKNDSENSTWYIGTEYHLIEHVAADYPDKNVRNLSMIPQFCPTMAMIDLAKLCWVLDEWEKGQMVPLVQVSNKIAADALICLERMLKCTQ